MSRSVNKVEIDLARIVGNFHLIRDLCGHSVRVMAIVKSDAYGHGLVPVSRALRRAGADIFGVAEPEEGVALREAGFDGEIVILLGVPSADADEAIDNRLTPVVYDVDILPYLQRAAEKAGHPARVHVKVDVGMGRFGLVPEEALGLLDALDRYPLVELCGIVSHLPLADALDQKGKTLDQLRTFERFLAAAKEKGKKIAPIHIANTPGLVFFEQCRIDMVRPGISLYGGFDGGEKIPFETAMRFSSQVAQVKNVPPGWGVSYGHQFVTNRPTRLAVVPVGYADGYLRKLTGRASVVIRGHRVPVVGRICMNACMADVTDHPDVQKGDEVVLLGRQQGAEVTVHELASWMETITYEVFCLFGSMNRKTYVTFSP